MFEAYRIRPVVETEGNDESKNCESFATVSEANEFIDSVIAEGIADGEDRDDLIGDYQIRLFWTLYGVNPIDHGVRTDDAIYDADTEEACWKMLRKLTRNLTMRDKAGYIYPRLEKSMESETLFDLAVMLGGDLATRRLDYTGIFADSRSHEDTLTVWANEFNEKHRNREWDGEYMEEIEDFYSEKVKSEIRPKGDR